ncbi:MAG: sigma-70 family RNA polymerase sigma factor [Chloroflexi bacterium]|nr:sigma-70 family RNA polymerase sigma factor [Chloroflexota bacterium]
MTEVAIRDAAAIESVVARAAAGDEAAFARLVTEHHPSMARVAYAITGDAESAADAVQIAWATAWRRLRSLRDAGTVRAWLVAIAANEARQVVRRQRRRTIVDLSKVAELAHGSDPGDRILVADLARALRSLDPDERSLLALRFAAGLDSTQIAEQLGLSASGVRSRLSRLIERLRLDLDHA